MEGAMSTAKVVKQFALCMTGISGSGKTTIANAVAKMLREQGVKIDVLDGDNTRSLVGELFGHSKSERLKMAKVNQAIGSHLLRNEINIILAVVAPFEEIRTQFRSFFGSSYIEIYVKSSVETCALRDVKGLYAKSESGNLKHLNGIDDIYEPPENSDIILDTEVLSVEDSCDAIIDYLHKNGYIRKAAGG